MANFSNWSVIEFLCIFKNFLLQLKFSNSSLLYVCIRCFYQCSHIYILEYTCAVFTDAYTNVADVSKGNHDVSIMSWLENIRTVDWVIWNANPNTKMYLWRLWISGMYPAFVKWPVSGSLLGSSSHVKESVSVSRCSMSRLWRLKRFEALIIKDNESYCHL